MLGEAVMLMERRWNVSSGCPIETSFAGEKKVGCGVPRPGLYEAFTEGGKAPTTYLEAMAFSWSEWPVHRSPTPFSQNLVPNLSSHEPKRAATAASRELIQPILSPSVNLPKRVPEAYTRRRPIRTSLNFKGGLSIQTMLVPRWHEEQVHTIRDIHLNFM